jgi:hypothetical protein
MRIKVAIANFGESQLEFLAEVLREFRSFQRHAVDITVYTTAPVDAPHKILDGAIGYGLPFACREDMAASINDYDLFLYDENDMLITEENIDAFVECQSMLPPNQICGFYRYELNNGVKLLLDLNPFWGKVVQNMYEQCFTVGNQHQGCWLLTRDQLQHCIDSGNFLVPPHVRPYGMLEQGASDPYTNCGLEKVLPRDLALLEKLQIRHLPLKYTVRDEWKTHGLTFDKLMSS